VPSALLEGPSPPARSTEIIATTVFLSLWTADFDHRSSAIQPTVQRAMDGTNQPWVNIQRHAMMVPRRHT
jgi:hypothetical protein